MILTQWTPTKMESLILKSEAAQQEIVGGEEE